MSSSTGSPRGEAHGTGARSRGHGDAIFTVRVLHDVTASPALVTIELGPRGHAVRGHNTLVDWLTHSLARAFLSEGALRNVY